MALEIINEMYMVRLVSLPAHRIGFRFVTGQQINLKLYHTGDALSVLIIVVVLFLRIRLNYGKNIGK